MFRLSLGTMLNQLHGDPEQHMIQRINGVLRAELRLLHCIFPYTLFNRYQKCTPSGEINKFYMYTLSLTRYPR